MRTIVFARDLLANIRSSAAHALCQTSRVVLAIEMDELVDREELRRSVDCASAESSAPKKVAKESRKAAVDQKEMLMPIPGKKPAKEGAARSPAARPQRTAAPISWSPENQRLRDFL